MKKIYKSKCLVIIMILILIILSSFLSIIIYKNHNNKIDIQLSNQSWDSYDESIKNIKNNMDPITEPNENFFWWTLKDFDIEDNEYENKKIRHVVTVAYYHLFLLGGSIEHIYIA